MLSGLTRRVGSSPSRIAAGTRRPSRPGSTLCATTTATTRHMPDSEGAGGPSSNPRALAFERNTWKMSLRQPRRWALYCPARLEIIVRFLLDGGAYGNKLPATKNQRFEFTTFSQSYRKMWFFCYFFRISSRGRLSSLANFASALTIEYSIKRS